MSRFSTILLLAASFAMPVPALSETAAKFLGRGYASCDAFFDTIIATEFLDEPDFFLCHTYQYKPLYLYGYVRDLGQGAFSMTLVKGQRVACHGQGDLVWSGPKASRAGSASGRFACEDGAKGGLAFELETIKAAGRHVTGGTIYGGVDENGSGGVDEEIDADFFILSRDAMLAFMEER